MSENSIILQPEVAESVRPLSTAIALRAAEKFTHRRREPPDDHLCTCGHPREVCVSATIRTLWHYADTP
ncbi:hypothetical protein [Dactylosporangium salmoneum]|uniref:Uncharacterized protein n=1 Tax=Dactylosporangium salmoneum TaxID=53361 RepID=A0ABN3GC52_9ACTN